MTARNVLVAGAGAAGTAAAITLQGNALRVLRQLGVWEQVRRHGYPFDTLGLRAPDGTLLAEFNDARTGGPGLPATLGMDRPALARILVDRATGMGIWRAFTPRPPSVTRTDLCYSAPCYIAGYCPTGEDTVYAYLVEDAQDRSGLTQDEALEVMRGHAAAYHGPWDDIRARLTDPRRRSTTPGSRPTWWTSRGPAAGWR
jgi:hypothetical protein